MPKKCKCGKEIDDKYEKCYQCYQKEKNMKTEKKEEKKGISIDLNKEITVKTWTLITLFILGFAAGAWLF